MQINNITFTREIRRFISFVRLSSYRDGRPVKGTLSVSVSLLSAMFGSGEPFVLTQTKEVSVLCHFEELCMRRVFLAST